MERRPRFAFLLLEEHPYGRAMLRELLAGGFEPLVVVSEDSELAREERAKFEARVAGRPLASTVVAQLEARRAEGAVIPLERTPRHRSRDLVPRLAPLGLDLVVLGGTRILRGDLLTLPRDGVVNSHPGLLPECRGSASPAWSVLHDLPVGSTTHLCDAGIDTGDLLLRREHPVRRGDTYEDLCHGTLELSARLMREALEAWSAGRWDALRRPQGTSEHPTFRNAPPEVLDAVRRKLAEGTYARFVD